MTAVDWGLVAAGLLFIAALLYALWRVQRWADRDFDRHVDTAVALFADDTAARRRHPATRAMSAYTEAAASTGWCVQCNQPVVGPLREHLHKAGRA